MEYNEDFVFWHVLKASAFLLLGKEGKAVFVCDRETVPNVAPGKYLYVRDHE